MATTKSSNVVKHPSSKEAPAKAKVKKAATEKQGMVETVLMKFRKDTKGANIYEAVNEKGKSLGQDETIAPSIYFRKSHMSGNPEFIEVTIREISSLSAKPKVKASSTSEGEDD